MVFHLGNHLLLSKALISFACILKSTAALDAVIRDLKQHDAVMRRRRSLEEWLFNCSHAPLITDPI